LCISRITTNRRLTILAATFWNDMDLVSDEVNHMASPSPLHIGSGDHGSSSNTNAYMSLSSKNEFVHLFSKLAAPLGSNVDAKPVRFCP